MGAFLVQSGGSYSTVVTNLLGLPDPSAVSFLHVNASNVPTWMTAANYRTALGLGTGDSPTLSKLVLTGGDGGGGGFTIGFSGSALGFSQESDYVRFGILNNLAFAFRDSGIRLSGSTRFEWAPTTADGPAGLILTRGGPNTLYQRNGTAAQTFLLANTYTDDSNYERAALGWSGNSFVIYTQAAGTGSVRPIFMSGPGSSAFTLGGTAGAWNLNSSGHFLAGVDNTYDIGASGATRPRDLFLARNLTLTGLPTSDPGVTGRIWNDSGTLKISP